MPNHMINWDEPEFLQLPDLRMAVYQAGTPNSGKPSVVLCHGFPEIGYSWRHIVAPLVEAGFHVVVPINAGSGIPDKPLVTPLMPPACRFMTWRTLVATFQHG